MIRLYHAPQSRSFRILWLLEEMGLEYDLAEMDFFDKSMRSEEFLALSPAGRVPALENDGQVLFESGAIAEYLVEANPECGFGRAVGSEDRARYLEWLHFAETIGQHLAALTQQHIVLHEDWMRSPVLMRLEAKRLEKALAVIEDAVRGREYLLESGFSAVDCLVGYGVILARRFVRVDCLPGLDAYRTRLLARPACQRAAQKDGKPRIYLKEFYEAPDV
ncbi:MAG: glutathione S-transferase [Rhodobacteraceae bacterium]|nr:glutathione S-transferase [Paracoccaceae bacterium]